jgi:hypothetical protein
MLNDFHKAHHHNEEKYMKTILAGALLMVAGVTAFASDMQVTASSDSGFKAFDGNGGTRWASVSKDNQWIQANFGKE